MVTGQMGISMEEKKDVYLTPYTKINYRSTVELNVKGKTIKLLEDNTENILQGNEKERLVRVETSLTIKKRLLNLIAICLFIKRPHQE